MTMTITNLQTHPERYVTVRELAAYFRVSPTTVRKWIACGVIEACKPAGVRDFRIATASARTLESRTGD